MAVNKVELGNETLIDLTSDTVQADTLLNGATAHAANGEQIVGKVNGVIYFENPQDYYNLSVEEREAINELVILKEDGEPLDASLITYGNSNVGAELQRLDSETTDLNNFKNNMSDAWNNSTNYEVGQYCIYNNILWKCLVQNIGQTPAEGTYWTKVTIGSEFNVVKNDIDTLNSNLKPIDSVPTSGYTLIDDGSFLDRDIQHIKCRISHPIVKTSAYLNIGTLPHQVKKTCYTTAILLNGSNVYPLIIKLQGTTISMFNSIAIQALDNGTQVESWIDCEYLISG